MSLVSLLRRILILILALSLPAALLGISIAGKRGFFCAEGIIGLLGLFIAFQSERAILKAYRATHDTPEGLRLSLARVMTVMGGRAPSLHVCSDPSPRVLVVKSLGSEGSILLSEGLLGLLNEHELRQILGICVERLRSREIVLQSFCAWSAHLLVQLAPRAWIGLLFGALGEHSSLKPWGGVRFLGIFPLARFFVRLGNVANGFQYTQSLPNGYVRLAGVGGECTNPGTGILHVVDPWASHALFPL